MPTYDYSCRSCGARFEAWQKMTDDPITVCPTCGGPVHRIIYPVGLVFKGSGFYRTDNHGSTTGSNGHHDAPNDGSHENAPAAAASAANTSSTASASSAAETTSGAKPDAKAKTPASTAPAPAASAKE